MSQSFYIVCHEKKIWMPIFSMSFGSCWHPDKKYIFDFLLECEGVACVLHEQHKNLPSLDDPEWRFINSWEKYKEVKNDGT